LLKAQFDNYLPPVIIDKNRIEQVLINLIYNAIKFTGPGGKIVVKAAKEANNILVSVTDTGCGIARDELPRVFERFYKVDKSRAGEGTGLGLSISRHIINAHGGRIWAASEERKGSTFYFTLPLRHDR
jgi:two-component system phosphate regulon sensor histidine kinase PhoR